MHIHIVAPSGCVEQNAIFSAQAACQTLGYRVSLAKHIFSQHRYLAGRKEQRLEDLHAACTHLDIDLIWCARGGVGAAQLSPYLGDWIGNKPIIGYSDSTVLLNAAVARGGVALHAPVFNEITTKNTNEFSAISMDAQETLALCAIDSTMGNHYPLQPYTNGALTQPITGKLLGGNLTVLASLQGTTGSIALKSPSILLIEDVGEAYYRLERCWVQLLQSIDTTQLKAVVMGDFTHCPQKNVPHGLADIFAEYLQSLNIPLFIADWFGHGEKNRPIWLGKVGTISNSASQSALLVV